MLSPEKLAFSRVLSRDLGLWVCAACYIRGIIENLAAYTCKYLYCRMTDLRSSEKLYGVPFFSLYLLMPVVSSTLVALVPKLP